jgi:phosphoribosylamine--glycine ligase
MVFVCTYWLAGMVQMTSVLLLGSGAREHALAWKLAHSAKLGKLYAAPGNPGIARYAELVDLCLDRPANIATWSHKNRIDLVVIGPEAPLFAGVVDALTSFNIPAFGPTKAASRIESSKSWSKRLMRNYGVPHAHGQSFTDVASAIAWLDQHNGPIVVKADGPSLGKGVIMCPDTATAIMTVKELMIERRFGAFGDCVVLEESPCWPGSQRLCDGEAFHWSLLLCRH